MPGRRSVAWGMSDWPRVKQDPGRISQSEQLAPVIQDQTVPEREDGMRE